MHETQARRGVRRGAAVLLAMVLALSLGWQRTWADEGRQLIPVGNAHVTLRSSNKNDKDRRSTLFRTAQG